MSEVKVAQEDLVQAANQLCKLADEKATLLGELEAANAKVATLEASNRELQEKVVESDKRTRAEKIAVDLAEKGVIGTGEIQEKVASLMTQDLDTYQAAIDLIPQMVGIGTVDEGETKTASEVELRTEGVNPLEAALCRHFSGSVA